MVEKSAEPVPVIAMVAIFGKKNEPILLKNYLCDFLSH